MRNVIYSVRRSGNHFLMETIRANFGVKFDKDHRFVNSLDDFDLAIYMVRDIRDVLVSNYYWWKKTGESWALGVRKQFENYNISMPEFIRGTKVKPLNTDKADGSSVKDYFQDPVEFWAKHIYSAKGKIPIVRFEDLKLNGEKTIRNIANWLGYDLPEEIKEIKHLVGFNPRKGLIGDWVNYLTEGDNQYIKSKVGSVMREFNYQ